MYLEEAKENVLMAERAVLYSLGFELNITHPYTFLMQQFNSLELVQLQNVQQQDNPFRHLMQNTWNFINDRCERVRKTEPKAPDPEV